MNRRAILIGNSDGIGLAMTKRLLAAGWEVTGISRSTSPMRDASYHHRVADVSSTEYGGLIHELAISSQVDLCIYSAGIVEPLNLLDMSGEARVIEVNLTGLVKTAAAVIPQMLGIGRGHFMGISSLADEIISSKVPSYHASKAGISSYLGGLALACNPRGVSVTNVRFGFVDTKMVKGTITPFVMSVETAVDHLIYCLDKKPDCYTAPKIAIPFIKSRKLLMRFGVR